MKITDVKQNTMFDTMFVATIFIALIPPNHQKVHGIESIVMVPIIGKA